MNGSLRKLFDILREPSRVLDRLVFLVTGIRIRKLREDGATFAALLALTELKARQAPPRLLSEIAITAAEERDCRELAELFTRHGSDKSTTHRYHMLYSWMLRGRREEPLKILEVGIGTNDVTRPSSMGRQGRPGV